MGARHPDVVVVSGAVRVGAHKAILRGSRMAGFVGVAVGEKMMLLFFSFCLLVDLVRWFLCFI